jgi:hypothetical protein
VENSSFTTCYKEIISFGPGIGFITVAAALLSGLAPDEASRARRVMSFLKVIGSIVKLNVSNPSGFSPRSHNSCMVFSVGGLHTGFPLSFAPKKHDF